MVAVSRLLSLAFYRLSIDTGAVRGSTALFLFAWTGWMALLFALSSQERLPSASTGFSWEDKAEHAMAYAVLALLTFVTVRRAFALPVTGAISLTLAWCALYGLSDEWHQSFVPGRDASVWDWMADMVGASIAMAALNIARLRGRVS